MSITISRDGYGYVEPNFLSAPRTGQVRADLPAASTIKVLMNGMFVKRDVIDNEVNFDASTPGIWWLVFNEEKLYDERKQMHKDYAMTPDQFFDGAMYPRILAPVVGDTFTTNTFANETVLEVGNYVEPGADGILKKVESGKSFLMVSELTTMPDGQNGVKLEVVANQ